ncbi:MAG: 50S ribosomal protein L24 [Pseudomonadota bacterium]
MAAKLKKGDQVVVLAGRDRGKKGEIIRVLPTEGRAYVSGINMVTRHQRQTQNAPGGRLPQEAAIDISNLAIQDPRDGEATRVGFRMEDGKKVRFAKKSGETIDG